MDAVYACRHRTLPQAKSPRNLIAVPACPFCAKPLETIRQREGVFYLCSSCGGRAVTIPQLRRVAGDRFAAKLLRLIQLAHRPSKWPCPFCSGRMVVCNLAEPLMELDGCRPCNAVWFDAPTYETMPEGSAETTNSLPSLATEVFAEIRLKEMKDREAREEAERKKVRKKRGLRDL